MMDIAGTNSESIECGGKVQEICFLPDESWIYYCVVLEDKTQSDIYRIHPFGKEIYPVVAWDDGSESEISFSHDGRAMIFLSDRVGSKQVYISNIYGKNPIRITDDHRNHRLAKFSPCGRYISYLSEKSNFKGKYDLWIYDRGIGTRIRLTDNANVHDYIWLDKSGTILYSSGVNIVDFNSINIQTKKNKKFIQSQEPKQYSETNPHIISYKEKQRVLYVRTYSSGKKGVYLVNMDGSEDRQATLDKGNSWLE